MTRDTSQRKTLARIDDLNRRGLVIAARRVIYEKHYQVNSAAVEAMLRKASWVPNAVCNLLFLTVILFSQHGIFTECILRATVTLWIQFIQDVGPGSNARARIRCLEKHLYPPSTHS
jgi:hypothetical protein